jgi:hypothetical protein
MQAAADRDERTDSLDSPTIARSGTVGRLCAYRQGDKLASFAGHKRE